MGNKTMSAKKAKQARYLAAYIECGADKLLAAQKAGVPESTMHRWFREDEEFREKVHNTFDLFEAELFELALERAKSGSDTMIIFLLKACRPERYCETVRKQMFAARQVPATEFELPDILFGEYGTPGFEEIPDPNSPH